MSVATVIALGNPDRGDDAIGLLVALRLKQLLPPSVRVIERGGDALGMLQDWPQAPRSIIVDAALGTRAAGTVHRIDLHQGDVPPTLRPGSTHALGLADAVRLARTLGVLPSCAILYAIEGACFDLGRLVGSAVLAAGHQVVAHAFADIARWVEADQCRADVEGPFLPPCA